MQLASNARRLARVFRPPLLLLLSHSDHHPFQIPHSSLQWRCLSTLWFSEFNDARNILQRTTSSMMMQRALYTSGMSRVPGSPTDAVKEFYDKMFKSVVEQRSIPPNAWLWLLIEHCSNHDDINLLFDILKRLRSFRLSNLRIHENLNCSLCSEITKACARVGAIDFGKKALWKHNLYGLTPNIGSAHHLLLYTKQHSDAKLMVEIMEMLKRNDLPLQPSTADIVFRICYNTDNWELISKYSKKFVKARVQLRQTSFDIWMEFSAKRGDIDTLWKIEKLISDSMKQHTLASGFSCAKGFLVQRKPENAAAIIQVLNQTLPDAKRPGVMVELQKLVSEWPLEIIKYQKEEDRKEFATVLQKAISVMLTGLLDLGLEMNLNMEVLTRKCSVLC